MPFPLIPLLLGATGFFAQRGLEARGDRRTELGMRQAVQNLTRGGGEISRDGFGPPTDPEWGAGLTDQQLSGIRAINQVDSSQALTQFIGMVQENRAQKSTADLAEYRTASLENQRTATAISAGNLGLRGAEFADEVNDRANVAQVKEDELGRLYAVGHNLELAREAAALKGKTAFSWINPETNAAEVVHMKGSTEHRKVSKSLQDTTRAMDHSVQLFEAIENASRTSDPSLAQTAELSQLAGFVGADVRQLLDLGVPTGVDIKLMEAILSDPTSMLNRIRQGDTAALEQLSGLNKIYGQDLASEHLAVQNWRMEPDLVQRGGDLLQRGQGTIQRQQGYRQAQERIAADPASGAFATMFRDLDIAGRESTDPLIGAFNEATGRTGSTRLDELRAESARMRNPLGGERTFGGAASAGRQAAGSVEEIMALMARFLRK